MPSVTLTHEPPIAVLALDQDVINAINPELVAELHGQLRRLRDDPAVRGLVLTSANDKFFCIGFDIPCLLTLSRDGFTDFFRALNRMCLDLYAMPKPTVAAITGHATAGGCILALSCDYRLIAEGHKVMGLNEVKLGVPIPYVADCILREQLATRAARDVTELGAFHEPEASLALGLVDGIVSPDRVRDAAIQQAHELAAMPGRAFELIKRNRTERVVARIEAGLAENERRFLESWFAPESQERLREAAERFRPR